MRTATLVIGIAGILCAALGLTARQLSINHHVTLALAAFSPYLVVAAPVSTVLLAATRRWLTATAAIALTALGVATQLPLVRGTTPPQNSAPVRILTANVLEGQASPKDLLQLATHAADVLVIEELSDGLTATLGDAGITHEFPYQAIEPGDHGAGVGIWSRYPITRSTRIAGYRLTMLTADIKTPGAAQDATVVAVHLPGPWPQPISGWRDELQQLPTTLATIAGAANGSVIAAGDFNATWDMAPFRSLLTNGYHDAAEQSGAGLIRTFPADSWLPPLIGIDHILTYRSTATDVAAVRIQDSDHLGLLATVHIPKTP